MSFGTWLAAAGLGGAGAVARFYVDTMISVRFERDFPYGTLAVNLSGAILLGLTVGLALRGNAALLIGSATIGAYTTFSTWMFETHRLAEEGELTRAVSNAFLSLGLGLAAAALGRVIGMHL